MPNHTPGPWTAEPPGIYGYGADDDKYWAVQTEAERIALVVTAPDDVGEYDALLIAAAPDMLGALRAAKDELISMYEQLFVDDESDNDTTRVIDRVIATINKAEGN
jgi:protein required for attachment to host cells